MARKYAEPTYRGFCETAEDPFGTAEAAATNIVHFMDVPTMATILEAQTDDDEYTGKVHRTEHLTLKQGVDLVHNRRLLPREAALFTALVGGSVVSAQLLATDAYTHAIKDDLTALESKSVTMWEHTESYGDKEFAGICCTQIEVDFARGEFCNLSATIMGDGSEAAGDDLSGIGAADSAEAYLRYGDVDVLFGGVYSETDSIGSVAAGVSKKAIIRSGTVMIKNNAEREFQFGEGDIFASNIVKGDLKADDIVSIELEYEPADATELDYLLAETEFVVELSFTGASMGGVEAAYFYTYDLFFPVCRVVETALDKDGSTQIATLSIRPIKDVSVDDFPIWRAVATTKAVSLLT
jgi:hypothetical protein